MLLIRLRHKTSSTYFTVNHSFISKDWHSFWVKRLYLFVCPLNLAFKELNFTGRKYRCFAALLFWFFGLLVLKFFNTLRVMNLEASQSKLSATDAACKRSWFFNFLLISFFGRLYICLLWASIHMNFQALLVKGSSTKSARRQYLVLMNLNCLFIVTVY